MVMNIYLAGPMRGYPEFNFPAFHANAHNLRNMGHTVFSPAEKDEEQFGAAAFKGKEEIQEKVAAAVGFDLRKALKMDLDYICEHADAVCLMVGWETSKGARAESATALALGLRRFIETYQGWLEVDSTGRLTGGNLPETSDHSF
jgi:hypothetical protein